MREAAIKRKTNETDIELKIELDGKGVSEIDTGCGFLDHMLTLFASHGGFDLTVNCKGDTQVDDHHTVEDIAICLGKAIAEALGDCRGITRYGYFILPMDESLVLTALDISGRSTLVFDCAFPTEKIGTFDTELVKEFFEALVRNANMTLHVKKMSGDNSHHIAEAVFKSFARSLKCAVKIDSDRKDEIPSTKGAL